MKHYSIERIQISMIAFSFIFTQFLRKSRNIVETEKIHMNTVAHGYDFINALVT